MHCLPRFTLLSVSSFDIEFFQIIQTRGGEKFFVFLCSVLIIPRFGTEDWQWSSTPALGKTIALNIDLSLRGFLDRSWDLRAFFDSSGMSIPEGTNFYQALFFLLDVVSCCVTESPVAVGRPVLFVCSTWWPSDALSYLLNEEVPEVLLWFEKDLKKGRSHGAMEKAVGTEPSQKHAGTVKERVFHL